MKPFLSSILIHSVVIFLIYQIGGIEQLLSAAQQKVVFDVLNTSQKLDHKTESREAQKKVSEKKLSTQQKTEEPLLNNEAKEEQAGEAGDVVDDSLITSKAQLLKEVKVHYPEKAKEDRIEGVVMIDFVINAFGKVESAVVVSGPGHGLNEAALEAIKKFEFKPAKIKDKAVAIRAKYKIPFSLKSL